MNLPEQQTTGVLLPEVKRNKKYHTTVFFVFIFFHFACSRQGAGKWFFVHLFFLPVKDLELSSTIEAPI